MAGTPKAKQAPAAPAPTRKSTEVGEDFSFGAGTGGGGAPPPKQSDNEPFFLAAHPARWGVLNGKCLPSLARVTIMLGLNDLSSTRAPEKATSRKTRVGWTIIPENKGPNGKGYLRRVAVPGGHHYFTCFERPIPGEAAVTPDLAAYTAWIEGLLEDGTIPAPEPWALSALRERVAGELAQAEDKGTHVPSAKVRAASLAKDLAAIDARIASISVEGIEGEDFNLSSDSE